MPTQDICLGHRLDHHHTSCASGGLVSVKIRQISNWHPKMLISPLDKIWNIMIWINDHDVPVQQPESMRQFSLGSLPILILSMKTTNPQIPVNETRSESAYCSPRQSNGIRFESLSIQTSTLSRGAAYKSTPMCDKAGPFFPVWVFPTLVMRVLAGITLGQFHIVNWPCS